MKATEQYFLVVLFIMLYKVVLIFESVDEILKCDHSNESYCAEVTSLGVPVTHFHHPAKKKRLVVTQLNSVSSLTFFFLSFFWWGGGGGGKGVVMVGVCTTLVQLSNQCRINPGSLLLLCIYYRD